MPGFKSDRPSYRYHVSGQAVVTFCGKTSLEQLNEVRLIERPGRDSRSTGSADASDGRVVVDFAVILTCRNGRVSDD